MPLSMFYPYSYSILLPTPQILPKSPSYQASQSLLPKSSLLPSNANSNEALKELFKYLISRNLSQKELLKDALGKLTYKAFTITLLTTKPNDTLKQFISTYSIRQAI